MALLPLQSTHWQTMIQLSLWTSMLFQVLRVSKAIIIHCTERPSPMLILPTISTSNIQEPRSGIIPIVAPVSLISIQRVSGQTSTPWILIIAVIQGRWWPISISMAISAQPIVKLPGFTIIPMAVFRALDFAPIMSRVNMLAFISIIAARMAL